MLERKIVSDQVMKVFLTRYGLPFLASSICDSLGSITLVVHAGICAGGAG